MWHEDLIGKVSATMLSILAVFLYAALSDLSHASASMILRWCAVHYLFFLAVKLTFTLHSPSLQTMQAILENMWPDATKN